MGNELDRVGWKWYAAMVGVCIFLGLGITAFVWDEPITSIPEKPVPVYEKVYQENEWCYVTTVEYRPDIVLPRTNENMKVEISEDKQWVLFYRKCSKAK